MEFSLREIKPNIGGGRVSGSEKLTSPFDLVQQMQFLDRIQTTAVEISVRDIQQDQQHVVHEIMIGKADREYSNAYHSDAAVASSEGFGACGGDKSRKPEGYVKAKLGDVILRTRVSPDKNVNPKWNEDLTFVVAEPFRDNLILSVEDMLRNNTVAVFREL
ncbi:hypothetical protein PTKIN_Ptkin04bG0185000 [Pterospermum kingtungense]